MGRLVMQLMLASLGASILSILVSLNQIGEQDVSPEVRRGLLQMPPEGPIDIKRLRRMWSGEVEYGFAHSLSISIVVSHCRQDLRWLSDYVVGFDIKQITVVSKCGSPPLPEELPKGTSVVLAPNVGRIDHTIASWMAHSVQDNFQPNDAVVFLKDNLNIHQSSYPRTLFEMLNIVSVNGFGCYQKPANGLSQYHDPEVLQLFNMTRYDGAPKIDKDGNLVGKNDSSGFKSPFKSMKYWLEDMDIRLPTPLAPVCYGGIFAVKASQIKKVPRRIWLNLEESLSRGDNIEEGHFMERTWASLLMDPISPVAAKALRDKSDYINFLVAEEGGGHLGALRRDPRLHMRKGIRATRTS